MDNKTQLIPFLEKLGQELEDNFTYINWGGCGAMAGILGEHLKNFTEINVVLFNGYGAVDIDDMREDIVASMGDPNEKSSWDRAGCGFAHVLLEIKADGTFYLVDSEGVHESDTYDNFRGRASGFFTLEETQGMAQGGTWNASFNRGQIPMIEETVSDAFERFAREVSHD